MRVLAGSGELPHLYGMLTIAGGIVLAVFVLGFLSHALYSKTFWFVFACVSVAAWVKIDEASGLWAFGIALVSVAAYELRRWVARRGLLGQERLGKL